MRGSCLCGSVVFDVTPPLRDVVACHCAQCRKTSGHYWAATSVPHDRFHMVEDKGLAWFRSSDQAVRGFCKDCGATLFWQPEGEARLSLSPGALSGPTGLKTDSHILREFAGDYYAPEGPPPEPTQAETLRGSCLCGANQFTLPGPMGDVWSCHCSQCRKLSGHYAASFDVQEGALTWQSRDVVEFTAAGGSKRGFCPGCGSSLYFRAADGSFSMEAGCIDSPTGGQLVCHIFVADKGDYYDLNDGLPQYQGRGEPIRQDGTQA